MDKGFFGVCNAMHKYSDPDVIVVRGVCYYRGMKTNTVYSFSVNGIRFSSPALGMNIVTPHGDWGMVFEVDPFFTKDGREMYHVRIAKSHRHESRWVTVGMLRCDGEHYTAL